MDVFKGQVLQRRTDSRSNFIQQNLKKGVNNWIRLYFCSFRWMTKMIFLILNFLHLHVVPLIKGSLLVFQALYYSYSSVSLNEEHGRFQQRLLETLPKEKKHSDICWFAVSVNFTPHIHLCLWLLVNAQEVEVYEIWVPSSHHDHLAVLDFSDELGLFAVPLLDVDQLVLLQSHRGLRRRNGNVFHVGNGELLRQNAAKCWPSSREVIQIETTQPGDFLHIKYIFYF